MKPDAQGRIPPDEMVSLSEDGIRLYPRGGDDVPTGRTTIINCTVKGMRRGICTDFGKASNRVIGSKAIDCVAAGFNVGSNDEVTGCSANARYAEALSLPFNHAEGANVALEILDSRDGMANDLPAKINGKNHRLTLKTLREKFIPGEMSIELGSNKGYLGKYAGYGTERDDGTASNVELVNNTKAKVLVTDHVTGLKVKSVGPILDH